MAPTRINAVAFIGANNHPILIRSFVDNALKYHYIAHTSLDVIDERVSASPKDSYLGLLYSIDDVAVYAYITPLNVKVVLAITLADAVIPDIKVLMIFKSLHLAYYRAISNPFLALGSPPQPVSSPKWKNFNRRLDEIAHVVSSGA